MGMRRVHCGMQVLAALFVLVPFCYLSGSFTINPVTEASSQARHLQLLSGCPPLIYWAGFYVSALLCSPAVMIELQSFLQRRVLLILSEAFKLTTPILTDA